MRLRKADHASYQANVRYMRDFILATPPLYGVVEQLASEAPEVEPAAWIEEHFSWQGYDWPPTERGRAKICWWIVERWANGQDDPRQLAYEISHESNFNQSLQQATQELIEPIIDYLHVAIGTSSDILYLLEKYRRRVEWFSRERLYESVIADSSRAERIVDEDLRRFLFDQGIDYPFSQPVGPSGRADIVAELGSDDPLVCELKLFDGAQYGVAYLAKGVHQAFRYARDYGEPLGYLVVANLTDDRLEIESDAAPNEWPPRLQLGGVTVFIVAVQLAPLPPASKDRKATTRRIARADLLRDPDSG